MSRLSIHDHDRGAQGFEHVYAVVSRRSRGVSVGINLNTNNACNWRCVYCQVPGLVVGKAPPIDVAKLEAELRTMLEDIARGSFMERNVEPEMRRLNDVAFSGNGEPTASPVFPEAVEIARRLIAEIVPGTKLVVITNGSLVHTRRVAEALRGVTEVWFKLDSATDEGLAAINHASSGAAHHLANLEACAKLAPTWVQICAFARGGVGPTEAEQAALLSALAAVKAPIRGVLLYGLARPSHQPEAPSLSRLSVVELERIAERIRALGLPVNAHP